jgi:Amt family ammonium transporter
MGIVSIIWVLYGYSLAFGPDIGGLIGSLEWAGLKGVGMTAGPYSDKIPHLVFCAFQLMFAIITPALITGAFAERMKFSAFVLFTILWSTLVYLPMCHWVWGGGWLGKMGALDFAGGTVIHILSGVAALSAALIIGKRRGFGREPSTPTTHHYLMGAAPALVTAVRLNPVALRPLTGIAGLSLFHHAHRHRIGSPFLIIAEKTYAACPPPWV